MPKKDNMSSQLLVLEPEEDESQTSPTTAGSSHVSEDETNENEFVVEKVLGKRLNMKGQTEYLIKWLNYPDSENTWERVENCEHCPELIAEYEDNMKKKVTNTEHTYNGLRITINDDAFDEGLIPVAIMGITNEGGVLRFLMQFKDFEQRVFVSAKAANKHCPDMVISFYEERVKFDNALYDKLNS